VPLDYRLGWNSRTGLATACGRRWPFTVNVMQRALR
jgi:hypothetical protein